MALCLSLKQPSREMGKIDSANRNNAFLVFPQKCRWGRGKPTSPSPSPWSELCPSWDSRTENNKPNISKCCKKKNREPQFGQRNSFDPSRIFLPNSGSLLNLNDASVDEFPWVQFDGRWGFRPRGPGRLAPTVCRPGPSAPPTPTPSQTSCGWAGPPCAPGGASGPSAPPPPPASAAGSTRGSAAACLPPPGQGRATPTPGWHSAPRPTRHEAHPQNRVHKTE